jgi:hypothetical protein
LIKIYKYCNHPDQSDVAKKAKLVEFLDNNEDIKETLLNMTRETYELYKKNFKSFSLKGLSSIMSVTFESFASDLPFDVDKFNDHINQTQAGFQLSVCLNALGPVVVAIFAAL